MSDRNPNRSRAVCDDCGGVFLHTADCRTVMPPTFAPTKQEQSDAELRGIAEGRRLERAAIVADLRVTRDESEWGEQAHDLLTAADRYERGEHIKEGT